MHDDDALVSACQSGDITAFEQLVRKYQDRTARMLYLLLGNADDAQDIAQETFLRAYRSMYTFRRSANFGTWLHKIAINTARNWIRSNKSAGEIVVLSDEMCFSSMKGPEEVLIEKERLSDIRMALASLPPYYREAVVLRHFEDLTYEEIAEIQHVPVGTVRSRLAKGRDLLQQRLTAGRMPIVIERTDGNGLQESEESDSLRSGR